MTPKGGKDEEFAELGLMVSTGGLGVFRVTSEDGKNGEFAELGLMVGLPTVVSMLVWLGAVIEMTETVLCEIRFAFSSLPVR